ncbi:MAG: hypothetical protein IH845_05190 [Nanoarchaeota archaeon]|nr:hypothetical protein [Nanoarchaeota archaeon]
MVFYNLRVGSYDLKYTPLKTTIKEYPYCDSKGNILKRVVEGKTNSYYINEETQEKFPNAFRLINNQAMAKLSKTKDVQNYKEVNSKEIQDLIIEKEYLVFNDLLLRDLKASGKTLKFGFTNGNGFKVFLAFIYINPLYPELLFMALGNAKKSEIIKQIAELQVQKDKIKSIDISIQGVDKAKVEDLIQI